MSLVRGFEAPIYPGFWKRLMQYQIPHYWFACWLMSSIFSGVFWVIWTGSWRRGLWITGVTCLSALLVLQKAFRRDWQLDDRWLKRFVRWVKHGLRSHSRLEAS